MSWTPARALGTFVFVGVTAGAALVLSSIQVDPGPAQVSAGSTVTTTKTDEATGDQLAATSSTTSTTAKATTTTTEAPLTGPVRLIASSRFDLRGVGPIEAGMTVHEAEEASGVRFTLEPMTATNGQCSSATPDGLAGLMFVVVAPGGATSTDPKAGTIARSRATEASFATVSNAKVGVALADARAIYAGRYEEVRFAQGGVALTIRGRSAADRDMGVRVEATDGQLVTSISSGLAASLAAPDGCA